MQVFTVHVRFKRVWIIKSGFTAVRPRQFYWQSYPNTSYCVISKYNMIVYTSFCPMQVFPLYVCLYTCISNLRPVWGTFAIDNFLFIFFKVVQNVLHRYIILLRITVYCLMQVFTVYVCLYTCISNVRPVWGPSSLDHFLFNFLKVVTNLLRRNITWLDIKVFWLMQEFTMYVRFKRVWIIKSGFTALCPRQFYCQSYPSTSYCVISKYNIIGYTSFSSHASIYQIRPFLYVCKQFTSRLKAVAQQSVW